MTHLRKDSHAHRGDGDGARLHVQTSEAKLNGRDGVLEEGGVGGEEGGRIDGIRVAERLGDDLADVAVPQLLQGGRLCAALACASVMHLLCKAS